MDQQKLDNIEENQVQPKLRKRRSDKINRNFTCGCGKSYLSYPALYTHQKQKHSSVTSDGNQPSNNTNQRQSKGRPKKVIKKLYYEEIDQEKQSIKSQDEQFECENESDQILQELLSFLDSIGNFRQPKKSLNDVEIQAFLLQHFPYNVFSNSFEYQGLLDLIKDLSNEKIKNQNIDFFANEPIDQEKSLRQTKITKILAYFLIHVGPMLCDDAYKEMVIFIVFYQKCLNKFGYLVLQKYLQELLKGDNKQQEIKEETIQNQEFCNVQNGEHMFLLSNEFILQFLPSQYQELEISEKNYKIFGSCAEKLKNGVYVLQFLSYWLFCLKFTKTRLDFYDDD